MTVCEIRKNGIGLIIRTCFKGVVVQHTSSFWGDFPLYLQKDNAKQMHIFVLIESI